jgi:hypothetical protein
MVKTCPKEEELIDYIENRLPDRDRKRVVHHLSECDVCLEEVVTARGMLRNENFTEFEPVPEAVTRDALRIASESTEESVFKDLWENQKRKWKNTIYELLHWSTLQLATVRGDKKILSDNLILIEKIFSEFKAQIEIEKTGPDKANIKVLVTEDHKSNPIRVNLFKNNREMASYLLNTSSVLFEDVPFNHYAITFTRDGSKIGEYLFEVKESRHGK